MLEKLKKEFKDRVAGPWRVWRYCKKFNVTPEEYQYREYLNTKIFVKGSSVKSYFYGFKHIIEVDYNKMPTCPAFGVLTNQVHNELRENKACGRWLRVSNQCGCGVQLIDDCFGHDRFYIACDDDDYAVMVAMKWS